MWLSSLSEFQKGSAIRGGIPICWPSFGKNNPSLEQHGFARKSLFELISITEIDASTSEVILQLTPTPESLKLWNYQFELNLTITISDTLSLSLQTINRDTQDFVITEAFHTYFNISHISEVSIDGLDTKPYFDALDEKRKIQNGALTFTEEFDSVYQEVNQDIYLKDKDKTVCIKTEGSSSAVVWNPWRKKCSRMSAMKPEAYKEFVCIESANAYDDFKLLKPQQSHTLKATFKTL